MDREQRNSLATLQYYSRLGVACLLGGIALIFILFTAWKSFNKTSIETWPTTQGVITTSLAEETYDKRTKETKYFKPHIRYRYEVNGQRYVGDKVAWRGEIYTQTDDIRRVLNIYGEGTEVTVYYNPDNHREAYLEPEGGGADWCTLACPGLLLLIALGLYPWGGADTEEESILGV